MANAKQPKEKEIKWSILLPTLNEGESLPELLAKLYSLKLSKNAEVLIIDSRSRDGTRDAYVVAARKYPMLYWIDAPRGKGTALKIGFGKARGKYIAFMDADMQYLLPDLQKVCSELESGADLVVTKRMVDGKQDYRRVLSLAYSQIVGKDFLKLPASDPQSGMKAIRADFLKKLNIREKGWAIDSEIIFQASKLGARIKEVEIQFHPRKLGKTKTRIMGTSADLLSGALRRMLGN